MLKYASGQVIEMSNETTVAWVSQHYLLPSQEKALEQKLGKIKLQKMPGKVKNANELYKRLNAEGIKYAVLVLPLSVIQHILNNPEAKDITFLRADMVQAIGDYNPETDVLLDDGIGQKRHQRFKEFRTLKSVDLITVPFEVTS